MFKTAYNYKKEVEAKGEHFEQVKDKISLTSPDMSYSVRELLQKFTTGQPLQIKFDGQYDENPSFDHIDPTRSGDFDLSDLTELQLELDQIEANIEIARQAIADKKASEGSNVVNEPSEA